MRGTSKKQISPSVRPPFRVSKCEMSHSLAWTSGHIQSVFNLILDTHSMELKSKRLLQRLIKQRQKG